MSSVRHAAIIAGGASRRMGQNKALMSLDGEPLISRTARVLESQFKQVVVVTNDQELARVAKLPLIPDVFSNKGPLGGIHAALAHFKAPVFCIACDLPFLNPRAIEYLCNQLAACDAALPRSSERAEPLHAVYSPTCLPVFEAELQSERVRRTERVLAPLQVRYIEAEEMRAFDSELRFLLNINTPGDARAAGFSL